MNIEIMEIKLGLPKGSLNTPGRGDTRLLFINAGYDIRGYEYGKESPKRLSIANDLEIKPFIGRPAGLPVELNRRLLDIAITGSDWIEEERLGNSQYEVRKIGDLNYGNTRLVMAVAENSGYKSLSDVIEALAKKKPIVCVTEYVNLTARAFMQNEAYRKFFGDQEPFIQYRGLTRGTNSKVQILGSDGATEGAIAKGADVIADNSQSGQSLIDNRLKEIQQIITSSAGLYAGPSCIGWKEEKAQEIFAMIKGATVAEEIFDVKFNTPITFVGSLKEYLTSAGLCADEPTMVLGEKFAQVNIVIRRKVFPKTLKELREKYGASAIVRNDVKQYID